MSKADLDWKNLSFAYVKTDYNIRYTWRDGSWSKGVLTPDETVPIHIVATCLHYGQEAFEGLKAFEQKNGDVVVFRVDQKLQSDLLKQKLLDERGGLLPGSIVLVNGHDILDLDNLATVVHRGDTVSLFTPGGGG